MDEPAHASDDEKHDDGELVDLKIEAGTEGACGDPGEELLHEGNLVGRKLREFADSLERAGEREARRADGDGIDDVVRPFGAEQTVDGRAEQGQERNDPEIVEYRH